MKKSLMMAGALTVAGMAAALLAPAAPAFAGDLNVTSWGGAYQMSQRKAYFEPYAKQSGTKITEEEYNGEIAKIRAMVEVEERLLGRHRRRYSDRGPGLRRGHPRDDRLDQARPRPLEVHRRRSDGLRGTDDPLCHGHRL